MTAKNNRVVTIIKLSNKAFGKYKKQILILILLGFAGAFLEGIGVNAIIPLFSFVIGDTQNNSDMISQVIEQFFGFIKIDFNVNYLLIFIIIMFVLRSFIKVYLDYVRIKITAEYENETRNFIFQKILKSDWPHLIKQKLGYLENIMLIDVPYSALILREISTIIMLATSLIVYLLVAFNINLIITLLTLALGLIIFLVLKPLNYKTKVLSTDSAKQNKNITHHITENILGIKTVKSMWVSSGVEEKGKYFFDKLYNIKIKIFVIKSIISSFIQPIGLIFVCLVFAFTYKSSSFNLASLAAIIYLIQKIFTYIQQLQQSLNIMNEKLPYLKSSLDYQEQAIKNEEENYGNKKFVFNDELRFNNVNFKYSENDNERKVLNDISFTVKKGEMVGMIGPSGVGKTTLVDLILRLLKPDSGSITLDGEDISKIDLKSWRKNIGYISQDMFLMNDTIANNIKFYDNSITDDNLIKAAKMANIYEFIENLPDKFETNIGERGVRLSAGQRQRVVIARILAHGPEILILDEATSALDNQSEIKIQKVLDNLKGNITVLAIAHRLTTVEGSDKLLIVENGCISEQGLPQELLKNRESYFSKTYNLKK